MFVPLTFPQSYPIEEKPCVYHSCFLMEYTSDAVTEDRLITSKNDGKEGVKTESQ